MGKNQNFTMNSKIENWDITITSKKGWLSFNFNEFWRYRDLIILFVKRDIVSIYKQTILGPLWYLIQPIATTIVFTFVFGNLAAISTEGVPKPLFYLIGISAWNYFSDCLLKTSNVFRDNAGIFGKVYFPRLISPVSIIISNLFRFGIQVFLVLIVALYYRFNGTIFHTNWSILLLPIFILLLAMQGLGLGMLVTAISTKYRDIAYLVSFGVQLMMYATTVIYPLSTVNQKYYWVVALNPMTFIIEGIKSTSIGVGVLTFETLIYSIFVSTIIFCVGFIFFNKFEKSFIDTI